MDESPVMFVFAVGGVVLGIVLFVRGLQAYRHDRIVSAVATSRLDGIAAGEVRVTGTVEVADQALVSPLQSKPCVWYRARVESRGDGAKLLEHEERAVHFRLRDEHGAIRVVPVGARWEVEPAFDASTGSLGEEPPGLHRRQGGASVAILTVDPAEMTELQRQAAVETLLTVRQPERSILADAGQIPRVGESGRRYREALVAPGETLTIIGQALPWSDVRMSTQIAIGSNVDRAISDDIARARAARSLAATPEEAWGNAAIPGFGIGRPTRAPELDPDVAAAEPAGAEAHDEAMRRHRIPDDALVLARGPSGVLVVYAGDAVAATQHHDAAFILGLVGIVMSASGALALGVMLSMAT